MSKYTPGPWKVIETNYLPHDGDHVADLSNGLMVIPSIFRLGEPLADARLIAAAPDLLLELDNCLDLLVTCFPDSPDNSRIGVAVTKARFAIAKATGETK